MYDLNKIQFLIKNKIKEVCRDNNIEEKFMLALVLTESGFNVNSIRYEPNYKWIYNTNEVATHLKTTKETAIEIQKFSYGLTQMMGANFYNYSVFYYPAQMFDYEINLRICARHLRWIIDKKHVDKNSPRDIYDFYNSGRVDRFDGNEKNVDRFMKNYLLF